MKIMLKALRVLITFTLLLSCFGTAVAANIVASLSRNPVMLDESFSLILQTEESISNPDLRVLEKDFDILNQSQSTNMSYMNGAFSKKTTWTISLLAKKTGNLIIPSISFGKDRSPSLRVNVIPASQAPATKDYEKEIYVETEVESKDHWVQAELIYTVRLFSRVALSNLRGNEINTSDSDAIIEQLGDATTYEAIRGGLRYAVREMRFAIYPQHSGTLTIEPMVFEGRVSSNHPQSIFDQFMNNGVLKRVRSDRQQVYIKPRPDNIKASDWLPATQVRLSDEWSEDISQLKHGEPVTRTITITADGPMARQIPELQLPEIENLKQYPNKPVNESRATNKGVSSSQQIKLAMIPTQAGEYKIPAISLPWWNTAKGRQETAHLAEVILKVTGAPAAPQPVMPPPVTQTPPAFAENQSLPKADVVQGVKNEYWPWISLLLGLGWLLTLITMFGRRTTMNSPAKNKTVDKTPALKTLDNAVRKHCRANDRHQASAALLKWAKLRWPDHNITSITDITRLSGSEMSSEIQTLNSALYSKTATQWEGSALLKAFDAERRNKQHNPQAPKILLQPLYKN